MVKNNPDQIDLIDDEEAHLQMGYQRPMIQDAMISGNVHEAPSRVGSEVTHVQTGFYNMATHTTELNKVLDKLFEFTYQRAKCGDMPAFAHRSKLQKQVGFLEYCFEQILDNESEFISGLDVITVLWKEPLQVLNRAEAERLIGYVATFADPEVSDKY